MDKLDYLRRFMFRGNVGIRKSVFLFCLAALATSCRDGTGPTGPLVSVCHIQGSTGTITDVFSSELADHKSHGDYVARLEVDKANTLTDSIHFTRVTDALAFARAVRLAHNEGTKAACRITIAVASGPVLGSTAVSSDATMERFPLVIDVPDITLKGALKMQLDAGGRATGIGDGPDATTFSPVPALVVTNGGSQTGVSEEIIVVNAHPNGSKGDGADIEGFVFQSGHAPGVTTIGGQGILTMRVRDLVVRGNRFEGGFTESVDLRASSGLVERNHLSGLGSACDLCLAGPGDYVARDNRSVVTGGIVGIVMGVGNLLPVPDVVEQLTLPASAVATATLSNNEVRNHLQKPVGAGLRIDAVGIGAPDVIGTTKVTMTGNNLVGNTFGIIVHAAFPVAGTTRRGDVELTTSGNTISQSCQADFLVTLTRHQNGFGLTSAFPSPLLNSTYKLSLGADIDWNKAWYANPAGFGNTLIVNGQVIPEGSRTAYDATRVCP